MDAAAARMLFKSAERPSGIAIDEAADSRREPVVGLSGRSCCVAWPSHAQATAAADDPAVVAPLSLTLPFIYVGLVGWALCVPSSSGAYRRGTATAQDCFIVLLHV